MEYNITGDERDAAQLDYDTASIEIDDGIQVSKDLLRRLQNLLLDPNVIVLGGFV